MVLFRRLLLLLLLMFWQGGFTFYASVVVPIGTDLLGSAIKQGTITRQVTDWMNVAGAVALSAWAWDIAADPARTPNRQRARWLLWISLALLLAALVWLHPRLDALFDAENLRLLDLDAFTVLHRWYLWLGTAQWAGGIVLIFSTLHTWRASDRGAAPLAAAGTAN
jgi:hypothetical protein